MQNYSPLKKTLLLSMIIGPVVIYVLALAIGYSYFATSLKTGTVSEMKRILEDHRQMIDSFLEGREGDLAFIMETYSYEELEDPSTLKRLLVQLQKKSSAFVDLGIFNARGIHTNYQGPYDLTGKVYKDEPWFREVMENGEYISDVFLGFRNIPHFIIAMVKHTPTQTWVIRATIDPTFFNKLVGQVSLGQTGEAYILNTKGLLQTRPRSGGQLMDPAPTDLRHPVYHQGTLVTVKSDEQGDNCLMATTWLKKKLWMLVVEQDKDDAFRTLNTATHLILFITIAGILIIVLVSLFLSKRIIYRLQTMDSEKRKLSYQLIHASGLAELGEMATGFAHEISNPLQIIKSEQAMIQLNLTEIIEQRKIEESGTLAEMEDSLNQISLQIDRCAMITQSIFKFGRRSEPTTESLNLKLLLTETIAMVKKRADLQNISINLDSSHFLPYIKADPAQLQQVFLNLLNNAIDAVIEKHGPEGGRINIRIDDFINQTIDVTIIDDGIGINPENLKKIFTPFFTTKPVGKGTGLGLSVCYGIIKGMGGNMSAYTAENSGAAFKISLPIEPDLKPGE